MSDAASIAPEIKSLFDQKGIVGKKTPTLQQRFYKQIFDEKSRIPAHVKIGKSIAQLRLLFNLKLNLPVSLRQQLLSVLQGVMVRLQLLY